MDFTHGISFEFKSVGVVDEAVENGVRKGGIGDAGVPITHRDLGGDQGGGAAVTVVEDLEQVFGLGAGERVAEPVVEDEQVGAGQGTEQLGIGTVGLSEFEASNWSQAVSDLTTVYEARPDFAAGVAAQHLSVAKVSWGDELLADGQSELAVVKYEEARIIKGVDTTGIDQKIAAAEAMLVTLAPSPELTEEGSTAAPGVANPAPAPTPTPTPKPLPYTLIAMSVKSNCDGYGYVHGIVWSAYKLPMAGVTVQAFNTTTGFGPLVSMPTNENGIYQIILEKDQIDGLWVVQVLENDQPASQAWGQHLGGGCVNGAQELKVDWKRARETD